MPLASLRCRSARCDDEKLNQKVKIATLKTTLTLFVVTPNYPAKVSLSVVNPI